MAKNLNLARRLKESRENRELKQADLAKRTGLQPSAISQFETGQREPSPENLKKLADALGVSVDFLLSGDESQIVSGPQIRGVIRYAQSMSGGDLDMLEDFAALLAKRTRARTLDAES